MNIVITIIFKQRVTWVTAFIQ